MQDILDDIPEEQRPIFEKAMGIIEEQTNEISRRDLMIETLKSVKPEEKPPKVDDPPDEDEDPRFKVMQDEINSLKSANVVDAKVEFETNLKEFASKNKDIVRYVKDMDILLKDHPTLQNDIPKLYELAKSVHEGRENPRKHTTETSGMSSQHVTAKSESKTIGEAFDLAESKLNKGGN